MEKGRRKQLIIPVLTFLGLIGVWEMLIWLMEVPSYIIPAPSKIVLAMVSEREVLLLHGIVTMKETLIGIFVALVLSVVLAVIMDRFKLLYSAAYPILVVSQTVPVIVLAPIFIVCFGFGILPKILIVVLMCFFPIVISFADGMRQVDVNQVNLVKLLGAGSLKQYFYVKIPAALPSLFSGLKVAATYSISGAVVGEWLASDSGLGYYMLRAKNAFMMDKVFASVVVVVLLSLCMNGVVKLFQRILMPQIRHVN